MTNHFVLPAAVLDCVANSLEDRQVGEYHLYEPEYLGEDYGGFHAAFSAVSPGDGQVRRLYVSVALQ